jgi:hypothetical protein
MWKAFISWIAFSSACVHALSSESFNGAHVDFCKCVQACFLCQIHQAFGRGILLVFRYGTSVEIYFTECAHEPTDTGGLSPVVAQCLLTVHTLSFCRILHPSKNEHLMSTFFTNSCCLFATAMPFCLPFGEGGR